MEQNTSRRTNAPPDIDEVLSQWENERNIANAHRQATYISTPITTGKLFVDWYCQRGHSLQPDSREYKESHKANVVLPNTQRAARWVELLRWRHSALVIDPRTLTVAGWNQEQYREFWTTVLKKHARQAIFLDGWSFSHGCAIEFLEAQKHGVECIDSNFKHLSTDTGLSVISNAIKVARAAGIPAAWIDEQENRLQELEELRPSTSESVRGLHKDAVLDHLADTANVAQFISFDPELKQRFSRIRGYEPNYQFSSTLNGIQTLLEQSPESKVNVRSFHPEQPQNNPFIQGLTDANEIMSLLENLGEGRRLHTIVNEHIDIHDGGVSGVFYRDALEFAPDATPRVVDDPSASTAVLPFDVGMRVLGAVYGFEPDLRGREGARVEFSIHPEARGWNHSHTIIWQTEQRPASDFQPSITWPNAFSRMIGDKTFGLVLAASIGLPVPRTIAFTRRHFPFIFGDTVGTQRYRTRTAPAEKVPGYYPSSDQWHDPLAVLKDPWLLSARSSKHLPSTHADQDETEKELSAVLIQEHVNATHSGRVAPASQGVKVRGVTGGGEKFMLGEEGSQDLPEQVYEAVIHLYESASTQLGPVNIEWTFDGTQAWALQVTPSRQSEVHKPPSGDWISFSYEEGRLEEFRHLVRRLSGTDTGVIVKGNVSPLSHLGEIAQDYNVPARFENAAN